MEENQMAQYITDLQVSLNGAEESEYRAQGYTQLPGDLNEGTKRNRIYLWYKKGPKNGITRIQFTFNYDMSHGLKDAGYRKINKNLNEGAGGDTIYLWFSTESFPSDVPITDLRVARDANAEAEKYKAGWERLACDLNRNAGGNRIYLFVKRAKPVYICDITATGNFGKDLDNIKKGYIRVDENTNREAGGSFVSIWYLPTTDDKQAIKGPLQVSINDDQRQKYKSEGYKPVNQDLNQGTGGNRIFLWYKKDGQGNPITDVSVIVGTAEVIPFENAGISVIDKNLNTGNKGCDEFVCFTQSQ